MKNIRKSSILLLTLILTLFISACSKETSGQSAPSDEKKAEKKDTLVIVQSSETRDLADIDPLQKDITLPRNMVFDTLLVRDEKGKIVPSLAQSFEVNGNTVKIKLKENITFQNGDKLTAESVKATLDKILNPNVKTSYKFGLKGVKEVKVVDDHTVEIMSEQPNYILPNFLAEVPILSAKQLSEGDNFKTQLNGTGPYVLSEWKRGEKVVLKKNDNYWGKKPEFKEVVIKYVADEATRVAELLGGKADIVSDLNTASIDRIKGEKGFHVSSEPGYRVTWLSYNFKTPFDNEKVRKAIYYAINREELAKNLFGKYAAPAVSPVTKDGAGYVEASPLNDFNVKKAKELIQESGVQTPITVDLDIRQTDLDIAQIVQSQLKQIGIETKINTIDPGTFFNPKRFETRQSGSLILSTSFDNPEKDVYRLFVPAYSSEAFYKAFGYKPLPQADGLIKQYVSEADAAKRKDISKQILNLEKEDASVLWLMHPSNIYGVSDKINWNLTGAGRIDIQQIKVK